MHKCTCTRFIPSIMVFISLINLIFESSLYLTSFTVNEVGSSSCFWSSCTEGGIICSWLISESASKSYTSGKNMHRREIYFPCNIVAKAKTNTSTITFTHVTLTGSNIHNEWGVETRLPTAHERNRDKKWLLKKHPNTFKPVISCITWHFSAKSLSDCKKSWSWNFLLHF